MKITEVKPNVFFCDAPGPPSNVFYLKTSKGIVLIDTTSSADEVQAILDLSGFAPADVSLLINTHADGDHIGGNSLFNCPKVAHAKTYQRMEESGLAEEMMPTQTFDQPQITLSAGEFTIDLIHIGGHKPDQTIIWLPGQKVLIASDLLFEGCYPFMKGSDVRLWIAALKSLRDYDAEVVLPGHGTGGDYSAVEILLDYLETSLGLAIAHKEGGTLLPDVLNDPRFPHR